MCRAGGFNYVVQSRLLVCDQAVFLGFYVIPSPGIFERDAGCGASDWRGVVGVGVEGRVEVNQVNAVRIHAAQDVEVVTLEDSAVCDLLIFAGHPSSSHLSP